MTESKIHFGQKYISIHFSIVSETTSEKNKIKGEKNFFTHIEKSRKFSFLSSTTLSARAQNQGKNGFFQKILDKTFSGAMSIRLHTSKTKIFKNYQRSQSNLLTQK